MKLGFVFPGQGSQYIGMGKDLYDKYEEIRKIYDKASKIAGVDIAELTFNSSEDKLAETKNTQLAILVMSLGILEVLKKENIKADISAGLSLGEYTSLIYSNFLSFENGIKVVKKRGELMQNEVPEGNWGMAAIIGLDENTVESLCQNNQNGFVVPANYNCPGQIVISGKQDDVYEIMEKAKQNGAKKVIELNTTGPFHTSKLHIAADKLKKELNNIEFNEFESKVVRNIDGKIYSEKDDIREILSQHMINPVRFTKTIKTMIDNGVDTFIEIGPGKTLSGFIKKINKDVNIFKINNIETLDEVVGYMIGLKSIEASNTCLGKQINKGGKYE